MSISRPTDPPPGISVRLPQSRPVDHVDDVSVARPVAAEGAMPTALPPKDVTVRAAPSTWRADKRFSALWTRAEDRNSWVAIPGTGWKQLSNSSDSAVVALTMVAAHAFLTEASVTYREEDDGKIHEIYVWG